MTKTGACSGSTVKLIRDASLFYGVSEDLQRRNTYLIAYTLDKCLAAPPPPQLLVLIVLASDTHSGWLSTEMDSNTAASASLVPSIQRVELHQLV